MGRALWLKNSILDTLFSIAELTISHMWAIAGLVEVLERKVPLTKQEVRDTITELRRLTPQAQQATPPLEAIPEPYLCGTPKIGSSRGFWISSM